MMNFVMYLRWVHFIEYLTVIEVDSRSHTITTSSRVFLFFAHFVGLVDIFSSCFLRQFHFVFLVINCLAIIKQRRRDQETRTIRGYLETILC